MSRIRACRRIHELVERRVSIWPRTGDASKYVYHAVLWIFVHIAKAIDLDAILTVVSVLMSGLDEMLRQVILQSQRSDLDVPFNNFQSRHDIEYV
jgi:hypothetical protein